VDELPRGEWQYEPKWDWHEGTHGSPVSPLLWVALPTNDVSGGEQSPPPRPIRPPRRKG
jgi:hypothetical protein